MQYAIVFPGSSLTRSSLEEPSKIRNTIDVAQPISGFDLEGVISGKTAKSDYQRQSAITTISYGLFKLIQEKLEIDPVLFMGPSQGEYAALAASGSLKFEDTIRLTKARMDILSRYPRTHLASIRVGSQDAESLASELTEKGVKVSIIDPTFVVIGYKDNLPNLNGDYRPIEIEGVLGAYHTDLMLKGSQKFRSKHLENLEVNSPQIQVLTNTTLEPVDDPSQIKEWLYRSNIATVNWQGAIKKAGDLGIGKFIVVGPKSSTANGIKRVLSDADVIEFKDPANLESVLAALN